VAARSAYLAAALAALALAAGCGPGTTKPVVPDGQPSQGAALIRFYGCGACHTIGGITGADAQVGPSLVHFREHRFIAGRLPNTVQDVERWIQHPQQILPGTIMPDLGVTPRQARDIAAYLYGQ
jgi:cytochrome c2